ncbi:MAG: hypothetical protein JWO98_2237 [Frankiales bacterium]|nr:hypothetical protein [Frankiales bacterium]
MIADSIFVMTATEPCPSWCQEPAGHAYVENLGEVQRWHRAWIGKVELTQLDCLDVDDDGVQLVTDGVRICVRDDVGGQVDLTPEQLGALLPDLDRIVTSLGG